MQLIQQNKLNKYVYYLINTLVVSFFLTVLTFQKGYSYAPIALGAIGLIYLLIRLFKHKPKLRADYDDKLFIMAFFAYFMTFALSAIIHKGGFREIDNPSRVLLFLTLLLLFKHFPLNIKLIFHSIPIGSAFLGILASYQKFYLGLEKPFPGHMSIQAGDIAIAISTFSFAITFYFLNKKNYKLTALYLVCSLLGMFASALTGARGGWIGLPMVIGSIILFYRQLLNKKLLFLFLVILVSTITIIGMSSKTGVMKRYEAAKSDIVRYIDKDEKNSSLGARFDMWENAWLGIKEKPILGWGSKGYIELKKSQQAANTMAKTTVKFNDAHNQFLDTTVKRGLIGLIGLLMVILIPLKYFLQNVKNENEEIKCVAVLGCTLVISHLFFFLSQTFFGHTSGTTFYFFLSILFYLMLKQLKAQSA
ncbi:O-antigen ligase family protein [Haemophilus haemoglobinophilus]|nr:O-antigen ligase family protein [Canicola haemoglobinophilus]